MGTPQVPDVPRLITAKWEPLPSHRETLLRTMTEAELAESITEFRAFATKHQLVRAKWGHLFSRWLVKRTDPTWIPRRVETA